MTYSSLTFEELERLAYINGNVALSNVYAQIMETITENDALEEKIEDTRSDSLAKWENRNGPVSDYYDFFHECFSYLDGHYPCPSVTSDYDKLVIFDAIRAGSSGEGD